MTDSTELAEGRTNWAGDRTTLANERTFAGWMRIGMASAALAIGLKAVFAPFEPTWVTELVATGFIAIAIYIFMAAQRQACVTIARLGSTIPTANRQATSFGSAGF